MSEYPSEQERMPIAHSVAVLGEIADERGRQIRAGWTIEADDEHEEPVLIRAAMTHVFHATIGFPASSDYVLEKRDRIWPWPTAHGAAPRFVGVRHHLIKATALLVAAIERIDRASASRGAER